MASHESGPWWKITAALMLLLLLGMDLLVWQFSGGVKISSVSTDFIIGLTLAFGVTSLVLLLVSIATFHRHMQWKEQFVGLALMSSLGLSLTAWLLENDTGSSEGAINAIRLESAMLINGLSAALAASILVLGLLLALITGRQHQQDPLLEMESTLGDVEIEIPE
ncbi:MAG: hypothetical protein VX320_01240 [Candidatus Thermoplasmatota archaeon]|nr:hypothetical protein [Candidatus Thermoplasmatota archaeon]